MLRKRSQPHPQPGDLHDMQHLADHMDFGGTAISNAVRFDRPISLWQSGWRFRQKLGIETLGHAIQKGIRFELLLKSAELLDRAKEVRLQIGRRWIPSTAEPRKQSGRIK